MSAASLAAASLDLAMTVRDLNNNQKPKKPETERPRLERTTKPVWWEDNGFMIDLTQVVSISTWHYIVTKHYPRGLRFHMLDGRCIDTNEMRTDRVESVLYNAQTALRRAFY